jgi:hypothetical protein
MPHFIGNLKVALFHYIPSLSGILVQSEMSFSNSTTRRLDDLVRIARLIEERTEPLLKSLTLTIFRSYKQNRNSEKER